MEVAVDRKLSALPDGSWALVPVLCTLFKLQEASFPFAFMFALLPPPGFAALSPSGGSALEARSRAPLPSTMGRWASRSRTRWPASFSLPLGALGGSLRGA